MPKADTPRRITWKDFRTDEKKTAMLSRLPGKNDHLSSVLPAVQGLEEGRSKTHGREERRKRDSMDNVH